MATISYDEAERLALSGNFVEAERICGALLPHFPDHFSTLYLLGSIKFMTGRFEESRELCIRLIELDDSNADVFNILGTISADYDDDQEQAVEWFLSAIERNQTHSKALTNLGNAYFKLKRFDDAREYFQRALSDESSNPDAINGLAMIETVFGNYAEAADIYRSALVHTPNAPNILSNMISALYSNPDGKEDAIEASKLVANLDNPGVAAVPAYATASMACLWDIEDKLFPFAMAQLNAMQKEVPLFLLSNLPLLSSARKEVSNQFLLETHKFAASAIRAKNRQPAYTEHSEAFAAEGRMRIGFISSDFNRHVVGKFMIEIVKHINREKFEIFLYSSLDPAKEDDITEFYRKEVDHFVDVVEMPDVELAEQIHADGIHVLVDLNGYTTGTRVSVMSYCPAPVQMNYLGYPFTYGMSEVDYIISDPWLDGPENARYCTEKPLRLSQSFVAIGDVPEQDINPILPKLRHGKLTFGSLNNAYKLNRKTVEVWSKILHAVPDSRLYLNHPNYYLEETRLGVYKEFEKQGIPKNRVDIIFEKNTSTLHSPHLAFYNDIDIALDSMPLTGGTTTIESLLMGVPVITLVGETHAQRMSYSIIKNVGINLDDCIAFSEEEYVARAVALAENRERLIAIRQKIPQAMRLGILGDSAKFVQQIEKAFHEGWDKKFKVYPIADVLEKKVYQPLSIGSDVCQLVVNDVPHDMVAHVLHEQGHWFESESRFLTKFAHHFKCFVDFAEDSGFYVVPFSAAQAATQGVSFAIRPNGIPSLLIKKSIEHNQLKNLVLTQQPDPQQSPDIVRFSYEYNEQGISSYLQQLRASSPLILASLRNTWGEDKTVIPLMQSNGYQAYRLLPGFDLLVPHQSDDSLYASTVNMFFCTAERAKQLQQIGMLCCDVVDVEQMPAPDAKHWVNTVQHLPYAAQHITSWVNAPQAGKWDDMYRLVLNLYADAMMSGSASGINPAQRWAKIQMAQSIITLLMGEEATVSRALTGIRLMLDIGRREQALEWLGLLTTQLQGQSGKVLDEPFFAPEAQWEQLEIGQDEALWAYSVAKITFERKRNFSSWFDAQDSLKQWEQLAVLPLLKEESNRMVSLLKRRVESVTK